MKILVTGTAGFIGYHLSRALLERGYEIVGIDNLNNYYDVTLKEDRVSQLRPYESFTFLKIDIADRKAIDKLFSEHKFDRVIHLAAQAGVLYSITNPDAYVNSNLVGFLNVLEGCRHQWSSGTRVMDLESRHLIFASSSSVYGINTKLPFSTNDNVDHPISLYAATKKAGELMAHTYSHLYGIPCTGLRFFSAYGPWGRPDMALFKFTRAILAGKPIEVYNNGHMRRDFTYVDDIVEGVIRVSDRIPSPLVEENKNGILNPSSSPTAPYKIYNIGNHSSVELTDFIGVLEKTLGKKAKINLLPMQPGDVLATCADVEDLMHDVGFTPKTPIEVGIGRFVEWYLSYYKETRK